nr:unnamed protein product [Digitaria exilis]
MSHVGFGLVLGSDGKRFRTRSSEVVRLGNTAVYLQYAHARICSIIQKADKDIEEMKTACADLFPHYLCDYLYSLSEAFSKFYASCQVVGSPEETSRLLLCHATAVVMRQCFNLLGITPVCKL